MKRSSQLFCLPIVFALCVFLQPFSVSGIPVPTTLVDEVVPHGANAPITCPPEAPTEGGDGSTSLKPCTAEEIANPIYSAMDSGFQEAITETTEISVEDIILLMLKGVDQNVDLSAEEPDAEIDAEIDTVLDEIVPGTDSFPVMLNSDPIVNAVVELIRDNDFDCDLELEFTQLVIENYSDSFNVYNFVQSIYEGKLNNIDDILEKLFNDPNSGFNDVDSLREHIDKLKSTILETLTQRKTDVVTMLETQFENVDIGQEVSSSPEIASAFEDLDMDPQAEEEASLDSLPSDVTSAINCVVSGTITNTVNELIVQALSGIVAASGESVDIASIDSIVADAISSDAISSQLETLISQGILEGQIMAAVQASLSNASSTIIELDDITAAVQSGLESEALAALVTEVIAESTSPESIAASLSTAVNNAVLEGQISTALQTSLQTAEVCGAIEAALAERFLSAIDADALATIITEAVNEAINSFVTSPELAEAISTLNDEYLETVLEELLSDLGLTDDQASAATEIITAVIQRLTKGLQNGDEVAQALAHTIATLMDAAANKEDPLTYQAVLAAIFNLNEPSETPSVVSKPTAVGKKPVSKKVKPSKTSSRKKTVVPFVKSLKKLLKKVMKIYVNRS